MADERDERTPPETEDEKAPKARREKDEKEKPRRGLVIAPTEGAADVQPDVP